MRGENATRKLAAIWALRATLRPKGFDGFNQHSSEDANVLRLAGLDNLIDARVPDKEIKRQLAFQLKKLQATPPLRRGHLFKNLEKLGKMMGLTEAEKEIFLFSLLLQEEEGLEQAMENLGDVTIKQLTRELSHILKVRPKDIERSLHREGPLSSSGLLQVRKGNSLDVTQRLELLEGLSSETLEEGLTKTFSQYFYEGKEAKLNIEDFSHLQKNLGILYPFLQKALTDKPPGTNILMYGPPGTGKTELARLVARDLGVNLYEVSSEDEDGDPADRDRRFRSYLLCQKLFSHTSNCLILFDEVEDVFPEAEFMFRSRRTGDFKGWTNRLLENNPVPSIWISNSIHHIDNAFIRRFDMVFEVPTPPRAVRKRILGKAIQELSIDEAWVERAASNDYLAPSHIEKAVKVMSMAKLDGEGALDHLITNVHRAMGYPRRSLPTFQPYDLQLLNTSHELGALVETLSEFKGGRVCLYGPPGSGKTAFVHYLAGKLDRPLLIQRASDIISPFIGETEQHIAAMFEAARTQEAILLLDEADSFLQDRSKAHRSWEITQVNELLVQLESFDGLFFCATNFMDVLDMAVFRRFDLKVKFDYLASQQVIDLFEKCLMGSPFDNKEAWLKELSTLKHLTPGDFVTAQRQLQLVNKNITPESLFKALLNEHKAKSGRLHSPFGFTA